VPKRLREPKFQLSIALKSDAVGEVQILQTALGTTRDRRKKNIGQIMLFVHKKS
jgi:hypothetical protein